MVGLEKITLKNTVKFQYNYMTCAEYGFDKKEYSFDIEKIYFYKPYKLPADVKFRGHNLMFKVPYKSTYKILLSNIYPYPETIFKYGVEAIYNPLVSKKLSPFCVISPLYTKTYKELLFKVIITPVIFICDGNTYISLVFSSEDICEDYIDEDLITIEEADVKKYYLTNFLIRYPYYSEEGTPEEKYSYLKSKYKELLIPNYLVSACLANYIYNNYFGD